MATPSIPQKEHALDIRPTWVQDYEINDNTVEITYHVSPADSPDRSKTLIFVEKDGSKFGVDYTWDWQHSVYDRLRRLYKSGWVAEHGKTTRYGFYPWMFRFTRVQEGGYGEGAI